MKITGKNYGSDSRPPAVLVDFDDTAAEQNVAGLLLERFGDATWQDVRERFRTGELTLNQYQEITFRNIQADRTTMQRYVKQNAALRPFFGDLCLYCRSHDIPLAIVSHGLDFYIEALLEKEGFPQVPVYAVNTTFTPQGITYEYLHARPGQENQGISKGLVVDRYRDSGHLVFYAGDGLSDFEAASRADVLFAHRTLAEECARRNIPFRPFSDFQDMLVALREYKSNRTEAGPTFKKPSGKQPAGPRGDLAVIDRYSRPAMKRVWSEENKYQKWLQVELAVCEAWAEEGVIPQEDMARLRGAEYNHNRMMEIFESTRHDVTAFLTSVTEGLGPEGRWLHLGLTSSDILDTALGLQLTEAGTLLLQDLDDALSSLRDQAVTHKDTIMMGRTHGVHAEPITFGLKLALWWEELRRQRARLVEALESVRVGKISGAVGTHATVPPSVEERVGQSLGLQMDPVSSQIVQRDRHAHFQLILALIAASLEKFATEIRSLQRTEVHEVEEPFGQGQTGSSAMPHKRNPELAERICGLARLIRGHSVTALENVALWGERDISHSSAERIIFPDSCLALDYILSIFNRIIRDLRVFPDRMWANVESSRGVVFSQRVLLALVDQGLAREAAYKIVQKNAAISWDSNQDFRDLVKSDGEALAYLSVQQMDEIFDYAYYTRYIDDTFQRLGLLATKVSV